MFSSLLGGVMGGGGGSLGGGSHSTDATSGGGVYTGGVNFYASPVDNSHLILIAGVVVGVLLLVKK